MDSSSPLNSGKHPVFTNPIQQKELENIRRQISQIVLEVLGNAEMDMETIYTLIVYMQIGIIKTLYPDITMTQAYAHAVDLLFDMGDKENTRQAEIKHIMEKDVLDFKGLSGQNQHIFLEIIKDIWQPESYNAELKWMEAWEQSCAIFLNQLDFRSSFLYLSSFIYEQVGLAIKKNIPPLSLVLMADFFPDGTQNDSKRSLDKTDILNLLIEEFKYITYLEVGVSRPDLNFDRIKCNRKTGVAPFFLREDMVGVTSDQYLNQLTPPEKFDLIFIDGIHHYEQLIKNINHALGHLSETGTIVCHEMLPESEQMQTSILKADCWKAWAYFRMTYMDLSMHVINTDSGLGIIKKGHQQLFRPQKSLVELDYSFFRKYKNELMNIVDIPEFKIIHKMLEVSVIIPNYNHAPYLKQRIDSVLNQTYQQFEILIMDDCSIDNSKNIIEAYRNHPKVSAIIYNEVNSGSTFKQWEKGILLAKGKYIWIAESDDWCEPTFLEYLMEGITSDNCVISYCQSYCIRDNKILRQSMAPFLSQYKNGRSFIKSDMLLGNSIFNASMALWKRSMFFEISKDFADFKFCGDWLFWIELCLKGDIHISGRVLNYFRKHDNDVSGKVYITGYNFIEEIKVLRILLQKKIVNMIEYKNAVNYKHNQYKKIEQHFNQETISQINSLFQDALAYVQGV